MKYKKRINCICSVVLIVAFGLMSLASGNSDKKSTTTKKKGTTEEVSSSEEKTKKDTTTATEATEPSETAPLFDVSAESTNMKLGAIAKDGDFYVGLACVRTLDKVQTAIESYADELPSSQEMIYPIIEIYNASNELEKFRKSDIAVYADSVKASEPETYLLLGIDGFSEYQSYNLDPQKSAIVISGVAVEKGWNNLTVFCGDVSWSITPDDISKNPFEFGTLFETNKPQSLTEAGAVVYNEDFELVYDGFEIYEDKGVLGNKWYAVFEYTLNNTTGATIDSHLWGYQMRGYGNNRLFEDATYTLDASINGHTNLFSVDDIRAGMSAKIYVAFEIREQTGVFECYFDIGYISNEPIAYVCTEKT